MGYPDSLLRQVVKPARYTGKEWNRQTKDWEKAEVKIALAYPDLYEIGMSNLALSILYELLNQQQGVLCERVFAPWVDMTAALRQASLPLISLESGQPLREFDLVGFSLGYELTYTNVLNMLDLSGIPILSAEREESHPLIMAGGSGALNPETLADFLDLFIVGEGEEVILELIQTFRLWKREGGRKADLLRRLASIPGIYVPSLYKVDYRPDNTIDRIAPVVPEAKPRIERRIVNPLPPPFTRPVVPYIEVVHDRAAVEIQRGCPQGCRFCQAGVIYRPLRYRPIAQIEGAVEALLRNCGYNELSLVSLSTSDYPGIDRLVSALMRGYPDISLSLPSLRLDSFSMELMESLGVKKKGSLTFAPEAGSERLRRALNKPISNEQILTTVAKASDKGWTSFKFYFMIGLPTETQENVEDIIRLIEAIRRLPRRRSLHLKASISPFVPKAHTPFQYLPQEKMEELQLKYQGLKQSLRRLGVLVSWTDPRSSLLEAVFSRGDRRLGKALHRAWQQGCLFDAWSESFHYDRWLSAFAETGIDPAFYAHRLRPLEETFPWDHIEVGVTHAFLQREYQRTQRGRETPDCQHGQCHRCGLERWQEECRRKFNQLLSPAISSSEPTAGSAPDK